MRTVILRAVAEPPQIFWAPVLPAAGNVLLNTTLMLFFIVAADVNPMPFFVTMIVGHGVIAACALRDPHLSNLVTAWVEARRKTVNLMAVKGNKYAP